MNNTRPISNTLRMRLLPETAAAATVYIFLPLASSSELYESERIQEYHKRKYQWPPAPSEYVPNTPGWRSIHQRRFNQTAHIEDKEPAAWNAYSVLVHSALLSPNFTEFGWGITKGPKSLVDALHENLMNGLEHAEDLLVEDENRDSEDDYDEDFEDSENPLERPLMIPNEHLNQRALEELLPIQEAWSGVQLKGEIAYGLRVYRNQSNLQMHIDDPTTHIISSILHVGHDPEGEPWPLVIEDFQGNTHEIYLETGDMLLYESNWDAEQVTLESLYRIPPTWWELPDQTVEDLDELIVTGTSFKEPECEHDWCSMKKTIKSKSPPNLAFGQVVSTDGEIKSMGLDSEDEL